jgi:hypothetical protein
MADSAVKDMTESTSPAGTDIINVVVDPGGTPLDRKVQLTELHHGLGIDETKITLTDITTLDVSTSAHGFQAKLPATGLLKRMDGVGNWKTEMVYKAADQTVHDSAVAAADNALIIPVDASATYEFIMTLYITGVDTTADFKAGAWTVPSGTTMMWGRSTAGVAAASSPDAALIQTDTDASGSINGTWIIRYNGIIFVSTTAGNVVFNWSQNTQTNNDLKVLKGSNIVFRRMA